MPGETAAGAALVIREARLSAPGTVERSCETCGDFEHSAGGLGLGSLLARGADCYVAGHQVTVRTLP